MTKIFHLFIATTLIVLTSSFVSTEKLPPTITKTFDTSVNCNMCKTRVEEKLNYVKGIVFAEVDTPRKTLTVKWKTKIISEDEIKKIVSNLGYQIEDVSADKDAQNKLPNCCQPNQPCSH